MRLWSLSLANWSLISRMSYTVWLSHRSISRGMHLRQDYNSIARPLPINDIRQAGRKQAGTMKHSEMAGCYLAHDGLDLRPSSRELRADRELVMRRQFLLQKFQPDATDPTCRARILRVLQPRWDQDMQKGRRDGRMTCSNSRQAASASDQHLNVRLIPYL